MSTRRIATLGAGPIGLEAGLALLEQGQDVHIYERQGVGDSVTHRGHFRLFSPFAMNHSRRGAALLSASGVALPKEGAYLTGS